MSSGIGLDIRIPIGGMFTLFGAIITIFGLFSDPAIYERSLGINVNLWWGLVMFAFGAFMLIMAWRGAKKHQ
jgi:membrane protein implicated in regulation of membrane protease activity